MDIQERQQVIESYGNAYNVLVTALAQFPVEMWQFKPSPKDFSIHEIIVHIADSEANSFIRARTFIAEPGKAVAAYDENQWAIALLYQQQSTQDALELFKSLRLTTYNLVKMLPDAKVWSNTIVHSENGVMTMEDWLHTYEQHIPDHINQMREVHQVWLETK